MTDPNTARSRTGFVILYAAVPIVWSSRLQTEVSLSSTEAELIALSAASRELIFLLRIIKEAKELSTLKLMINNSQIKCTIHEDNMSTIELAKEYRIRPRTKHINVKYWHFNQFMLRNKDIITIKWIPSKEQLADMLTKPLSYELHEKFARMIQGWDDYRIT